MVNKWLLAASAASMSVFLLHLIGGGVDVHAPTLASAMSDLLKAYASVLWHFASAALLINSVALYLAARRQPLRVALTQLVIAQYLAFAALFMLYGLTRMGSLTVMPQWLLFLPIAALALYGLRAERQGPIGRPPGLPD